MKTIPYNKLVRDRVPKIIEASGKTCTIEVLPDKTHLEILGSKLDEELAECHKDHNIEELADLLEVICTCVVARGFSSEKLERLRIDMRHRYR